MGVSLVTVRTERPWCPSSHCYWQFLVEERQDMAGWLRSQGPSSSCLGFTPSLFLVTCCLLFLQIFWSPFLQPKIRSWVFYPTVALVFGN